MRRSVSSNKVDPFINMWDKENIQLPADESNGIHVYQGHTYVTIAAAQRIAESLGKKVPIANQLRALINLGSSWDTNLRGRWFGEDHELKSNSKYSIFFPAIGSGSVGGNYYYVGNNGVYWSSTYNAGSGSWSNLWFSSGNNTSLGNSNSSSLCPLRLIR